MESLSLCEVGPCFLSLVAKRGDSCGLGPKTIVSRRSNSNAKAYELRQTELVLVLIATCYVSDSPCPSTSRIGADLVQGET